MTPEPATLAGDAAGLKAVFDELAGRARATSQQLAECHHLLTRIALDDLIDARPVTGAVRALARKLLVRHGVLQEGG